MTPRIVLVGPPGAGKSTVGARLAERLELDFVDVDEVIADAAGQSISDIFILEGEPAFRARERVTTVKVLGSADGVVSLGGGAPMQPEVATALAGHTVCFLDVAIADAARRVGFDGSRPLLAVNPRATWTAMMAERRPTYERVATMTVDTAGRTPDDIVDEIVAALA